MAGKTKHVKPNAVIANMAEACFKPINCPNAQVVILPQAHKKQSSGLSWIKGAHAKHWFRRL